jgi:acetolactate synthase-1/2/3 large subunit
LAEAIRVACSEPMGPVHLDLPEDVALAPARERVPNLLPSARPLRAPDDAIRRAFELIASARRPIAVIGSSALRLADPGLLRKLIERHNLPFATTCMAKGLIDEDHQLALGCIERACRQVQRRFLRSADLIVGLGYDTIEVEYEAWIDDVPLLQIDIEPVDVSSSVRLLHEVTGDLDAALTRLAAFPPAANVWPQAALAEHRRAFQAALRPPSRTFTAHAAIDAVRRALPRNGVLSFDVGAHTHQIASQWTAHAPKSFLITNGWSSMGFGLPGAIAAKLARPQLPVVCLLGDGCFQMTCGEVATAKRLGLTLPVVVLDDKWLALIKVKQIRRQYPLYGTQVQEEEYREPPSHYFGVPALGVRSADGLQRAVKAALAAKGPSVIEAVVDSDHYLETVYD